jgi:hypothetical protein
MKITFTRTGECTYTTVALRDDGVLLEIASSDRTLLLPHDLVHYVVERELGLPRGFWGAVAVGALFPSVKVISGRQPPHAAERSRAILREVQQYGPEAEVLGEVMLRLMQSGLEDNDAAVRAALAKLYQPRQPSRGPLAPEEVQRVCTELREVQQRWQALAEGESLTVSWPVEKRPPCSPARREQKGYSQKRRDMRR